MNYTDKILKVGLHNTDMDIRWEHSTDMYYYAYGTIFNKDYLLIYIFYTTEEDAVSTLLEFKYKPDGGQVILINKNMKFINNIRNVILQITHNNEYYYLKIEDVLKKIKI